MTTEGFEIPADAMSNAELKIKLQMQSGICERIFGEKDEYVAKYMKRALQENPDAGEDATAKDAELIYSLEVGGWIQQNGGKMRDAINELKSERSDLALEWKTGGDSAQKEIVDALMRKLGFDMAETYAEAA